MSLAEIKSHQVICSAFIEREGKILIILCPKFRVWRVLGGRAEHGEKLEETLLREMKEETKIAFKNPKFIGFGQDQQFNFLDQKETSRLIMFFHLKTKEKPRLDPKEAKEHKWVTLNELIKMNNKDKEGALTDFFKRNPNFAL